MKRILSVLLALLLLIASLAACSEAAEPEEALSPVETEIPEPEEVPPPAPPPVAAGVTAANIQVQFATEELLAQFDSIHEVVGFDEGADYARIAITTDLPVQRIGFYEFGLDDNLTIEWTRTLYFIQELSPEIPFVVTWMPGMVPQRGISLLDGEQERAFIINLSDDNLLYFHEIETGLLVDADSNTSASLDENAPPPTENIGVGSANVRLFFLDDENTRQWTPAAWLFDLDQAAHYHAFYSGRGYAHLVFTTDALVRDFRFFEITFNETFSEGGDEPLYLVANVLYTLDELRPDLPFVVVGAGLGCAVVVNGFSFVDEDGITRYFAIQGGMADFEPPIFAAAF